MSKFYLHVFKRNVTDKEGRTFVAYNACQVIKNEKGEYVPKRIAVASTDKDGNPTIKAVYLKTIFLKGSEIRKQVEAEDNFPYRICIDFEAKDENGYNAYLTKDKDQNGKPRYDKNGVRHHVLLIRKVESIEHFDLPITTLDDIDC